LRQRRPLALLGVQYIVGMEPRGIAKGHSTEIVECRDADHVPIKCTTTILDPGEANRFLAALDDAASFDAGLAALTERPSVIE
jgi:hypothetical protein